MTFYHRLFEAKQIHFPYGSEQVGTGVKCINMHQEKLLFSGHFIVCNLFL